MRCQGRPSNSCKLGIWLAEKNGKMAVCAAQSSYSDLVGRSLQETDARPATTALFCRASKLWYNQRSDVCPIDDRPIDSTMFRAERRIKLADIRQGTSKWRTMEEK